MQMAASNQLLGFELSLASLPRHHLCGQLEDVSPEGKRKIQDGIGYPHAAASDRYGKDEPTLRVGQLLGLSV